ncbi:MAG: CDP-glucose 4,6-dehydratase [Actinobacteria bacterium]|nr:MAG: CDP-glucose 4,6-dehydratase [Actinomycetota bacterium]
MSEGQLFGGIFKGKKILVTGNTGFKGSWLTLWLNSLGASIIGYSLDPPTDPSLFEILKLEKNITQIKGDVRNKEYLQKTVEQFKPDIVFHLAAQPLVRSSYEEPHLTYETNVMGTVNLFEAVRNTDSVRVVVNITSDKCYKNREADYSYKEQDPMGGFDPYSSSKGCSELVTLAYINSFFSHGYVSLASVRAGNVVGGGDWAVDRIIPDCIRALVQEKPVLVRSPQAVRPWQHVLEPLSGYLWLAACMWQNDHKYDGAWNFGPNKESNITVKAVVESVINEWGSGRWEQSNQIKAQPHEAGLLMLDHSKARKLLLWQPIYGINRTLEVTTNWYKAYYDNSNIKQVTLANLNDYIKQAKKQNLSWTLVNQKVGV